MVATSWALMPSEIGTLTLPLCSKHAHTVANLAAWFRLVAVPAEMGHHFYAHDPIPGQI